MFGKGHCVVVRDDVLVRDNVLYSGTMSAGTERASGRTATTNSGSVTPLSGLKLLTFILSTRLLFLCITLLLSIRGVEILK